MTNKVFYQLKMSIYQQQERFNLVLAQLLQLFKMKFIIDLQIIAI